MNGGGGEFFDCSLYSNWTYGVCSADGGAICAWGVNYLVVESCSVTGNYAYGATAGAPWGRFGKRGGAIYMSGNSLTGRVVSSEICANGTDPAHVGDLHIASGNAVGLTNNLIAGNKHSGITCEAGAATTVTVVNCTLADNSEWGLTNSAATVSMANCVAWGNTEGGINTNGAVVVSYSCSQETIDGDGNMSLDPLFVDTANGDYHLQSRAGSWHGGVWILDYNTSPCIDAGDQGTQWTDLEPHPNGSRVNMGAYGNSAQASRTMQTGTMFMIR